MNDVSNVIYKSNLHIVESNKISQDKNFLNSIRDPFALEQLKTAIDRRQVDYRLSPIQQDEYDKVSLHCSYAEKGDYPFGTIIENGQDKIKCKCFKTTCRLFFACRPDFKAEELSILEDNLEYNGKIKSTSRLLNEEGNKDTTVIISAIRNGLSVNSNISNIVPDKQEDGNIVEIKDEGHQLETNMNTVFSDIQKSESSGIVEGILDTDDKSDQDEAHIKKPDRDSQHNNQLDKFTEVSQQVVIDSDVSSRIFINAGPGTGKTWTLIERLVYLVNEAQIDPEEIMILCFSRAAVEVIKGRLKAQKSKGRIGLVYNLIDIRTFDSFATHLLAWISEEEPQLLYSGFNLHNLSYDQRIRAASECITKGKELLSQCQHLIVDEIQDLVTARAELVISIIKSLLPDSGFTLLGDSCQSIYDYQVDGSEMDSYSFYQYFFKNHSEILYYSFSRNYRQVTNLEELSDRYRQAILSQDNEDIHNSMITVSKDIDKISNLNLINATKEELNEIIEDKPTGILTRSNGLALKISTWLRNQEIPHSILHRSTQYELNRWIAGVLYDYTDDTINFERFKEAICKFSNISGNTIELLWEAFSEGICNSGDRYKVALILKGITDKGKHSLLFKNSSDHKLIISNIHKSKGKEYNNVVLLDEIFSDKEKDIQEHKVNYVAITRAKEKILSTQIAKQKIKIFRRSEPRCYQLGNSRTKKKPLSHIEFGLSTDINQKSFALKEEIQKIIINRSLVGSRVELVKNRELSNSIKIIYDIRLEEANSACTLGQTSNQFSDELKKIFRYIYKMNKNTQVNSSIFPERFSDIYIDDVITVIDNTDNKLKGAKQFGNMMIWHGLSLSGFALRERDIY